MNSIMAPHTALEANAFYRHKKFDQAKHKSTDSSSSSTSSYGELRDGLEMERKVHPFLKHISNVTMSHFNWPVLETKSKRNHASDLNGDQQLPAAKRSCNFSVASNTDHCEPSGERPQGCTVSAATQLQQANILSALEKGLKRKFTSVSNANQQLPLAKRPCATSSIVSSTDQYVTVTSNSDQHLSPAQRPYTTNVISNSSQHVPLTQRNCTSTVTSECNQYVAPAQGTTNSYVSTRMPALEKEAQRNLPAVADTYQNMPPPTRPRSFSASTSRSAYPFLRLSQQPLNNTPLASVEPTKARLTPASSTNQHATIKPPTTSSQEPCTYTLTSASYPHKTTVPVNPSSTYPGMANTLTNLANEPKINFAPALSTDQDTTPFTRPRSFSAGTGSLAYSMQPQWTNTSLTLKDQRGLTPASNTAQVQPPAQTRPLNFSSGTRGRSSSFGVANTLSSSYNKELKRSLTTALNADQNIDPATRPRSYSASTSSSTSSLASLMQLRRANISISPPVIPPPTAILPKISHETLHNICKYHGNMVRKFPKKERTPKDQERRNKNTIACRMSRRVKKLEQIAMEEQYKEFRQKTFEIIKKSMRATAYLHELIKLCKSDEEKIESPAEVTKTERLPVTAQEKKPFTIAIEEKTESPAELTKTERLPVTAQEKKPFTIAFLAGTEEK